METQEKSVAVKPKTLREMLSDVSVKKRFEDMLGNKAAAFMSSIITVAQGNEQLQKADPLSIIAAAAISASLDLPITPSLGQACIVPYNVNKKVGDKWEKHVVAQFQIMARGFVQLGLRSKQYKTMNATEVYEGEITGRNRLTGELDIDPNGKKSETVIGYLFYFKLLNGFEKYVYMTVEECRAHGKKYSKSYDNDNGKWKQDFPVMAMKTVVKQGLSKWGPLSTEMQKGIEFDQAAVTPDGKPEYIDTTADAGSGGEKADPEMPKSRSQKALPPPKGDTKMSKASGSFLVERVTTTEKDGETVYCIYIDGVRYETPDKATSEACKKWAEEKTPVAFVADGSALAEIRKA